ncbi:MAG: toxin-antitoxin system HicB family antitoxin [Acidobacteria bacterium]|nr:toxin-antitoxin system HicB family antitoxin [Acidobacteriota bacterium]
MSTLTIRLPDDTHARMKALARGRAISVNKLMEELCTMALTQHDAETRFRALAARGSAKDGLRVLDKLDAAFAGGDGPKRRTGEALRGAGD